MHRASCLSTLIRQQAIVCEITQLQLFNCLQHGGTEIKKRLTIRYHCLILTRMLGSVRETTQRALCGQTQTWEGVLDMQ